MTKKSKTASKMKMKNYTIRLLLSKPMKKEHKNP